MVRKKGLYAVLVMALVIYSPLMVRANASETSIVPPPMDKTIFIPEEAFEKIFREAGKGMFLTYGEFMNLWYKAHANPGTGTTGLNQVKPAITQVTMLIIPEEKYVKCIMLLNVGKLGPGSFLMELPGTYPFMEARFVPGAPTPSLREGKLGFLSRFNKAKLGYLLRKGNQTYFLSMGNKPGTLMLVYRLPVVYSGETGSVEITVPVIPARQVGMLCKNEWVVSSPSIMGLEYFPANINGSTRGKLSVFYIRTGINKLKLTWRPETSCVDHSNRMASYLVTQVKPGPGLLKLHTTCKIFPIRGTVSSVDIILPLTSVIKNVSHPNLLYWQLESTKQYKVLRVNFQGGFKSSIEMSVDYVVPLPGLHGEVALRLPAIKNAYPLQGKFNILTGKGVILVPRGTGKLQHSSPVNSSSLVSFQYFDPGFDVTFKFFPPEPSSYCYIVSKLQLEDGVGLLKSVLDVQLYNKPKYRLQLGISSEYNLEKVILMGKKPRALSWEKTNNTLFIQIPADASDRDSMQIGITGDVMYKTGEKLSMPVIVPRHFDDWEGQFAILSAGVYAIGEEKLANLFPTGYSTFREVFPGIEETGFLAGYQYNRDYSNGTMVVTNVETSISLESITVVRFEQNKLNMDARLSYDIEGAGARNLEFILPYGTGEKIGIHGRDIREKKLVRSTSSVGDLWRIEFSKPVNGTYLLDVEIETVLPGKQTKNYRVPEIQPRGINREIGYLVIEASDELELEILPTMLMETSVQKIPGHLRNLVGKRILKCYQFFEHPLNLAVNTTVHDKLPVLMALIKHVYARSLVMESGTVLTEVSYNIQTTNLQFLELKLPSRTNVWSALVNDEPVKPFNLGNKIRIPLTAHGGYKQGKKVVVLLQTKLKPFRSIAKINHSLPDPCELPVLETSWRVYFPEKYVSIAVAGDFPGMETPQPALSYTGLLSQVKSFLSDLVFPSQYSFISDKRSVVEMSKPLGSQQGLSMDSLKKNEMETKMKSRSRRLQKLKDGNRLSAQKENIGMDYKLPREEQPLTEPPVVPPKDIPEKDKGTGLLSMHINVDFSGPSGLYRSAGSERNVRLTLVKSAMLAKTRWVIIFLTLLLGVYTKKKYGFPPMLYIGFAYGFIYFLSQVSTGWGVLLSSFIKDGLLLFLVLIIVRVIRTRFIRWHKSALIIMLLTLMPAISLASEPGNQPVTPTPLPGITLYAPWKVGVDNGQVSRNTRVFLSEKDFKLLWDAAYPSKTPTPSFMPVEYLFAGGTYRGNIQNKQVSLKLETELVILKQGWCQVPLKFSDVTIAGIEAGGKNIPVSYMENVPFLTLKGPATYNLVINFSVPIQGNLNQGTFKLGLPVIPAAKMLLDIPVAPLEIQLDDDNISYRIKQSSPGKTGLELAIGGVSSLKLNWSKVSSSSSRATAEMKSSDDDKKPLVSISQNMMVFLDKGWSLIHGKVSVNISNKSVNRLRLIVPQGWDLLNVEGSAIESWKNMGENEIVISLNARVVGGLVFHVELETASSNELLKTLYAPRFPDAYRVEGNIFVAIRKDSRMKNVVPERLHRIDITNTVMPSIPFLRKNMFKIVSGYKFFTGKWSLTYQLGKLPSRIKIKDTGFYRITHDRYELETTIEYNVAEGSAHYMNLVFPSNLKIRSIQMDPHQLFIHEITRLPGSNEQVLRVIFRDPVVDSAKLIVGSTFDYEEDLRETGVKDIDLPVIKVQNEQEVNYVLRIFESPGVRTVVRDKEGFNEWNCPPSVNNVEYSCFRTFECLDECESLGLTLKLMDGKTNATVVQSYTINDDVYKAEILVSYKVLEGSIDHVLIQCPEVLANKLKFNGDNIRKKILDIMPGSGISQWKITFHEPVVNVYDLTISYEYPLTYGSNNVLPVITPLNNKELDGYIILENYSRGVFKITGTNGLSEIDLGQIPYLPGDINKPRVVASLKHGEKPWNCSFKLEKLKQEKELSAYIDYIHLETVVTHKGDIRNKMVCHLQNQTEQFLEIFLPDNAQVWSAFVNGIPVKPVYKKDEPSLIMVPITRNSPTDRAFDTEIYYVLNYPTMEKTWGKLKFKAPVIKNIPVKKSLWSLWLPYTKHYSRFAGNMDPATDYVILAEKVISTVDEQSRLINLLDGLKDYEKTIVLDNLNAVELRYSELMNKLRNVPPDHQLNKKLIHAKKQFSNQTIITNQYLKQIRLRKQQQTARSLGWVSQGQVQQDQQREQMLFRQQQLLQLSGGTIRGTVKDNYGNPLPGATIYLDSFDMKNHSKTVANSYGEYIIAGFPAGTINLTVKHPELKETIHKVVKLSRNRVLITNIVSGIKEKKETEPSRKSKDIRTKDYEGKPGEYDETWRSAREDTIPFTEYADADNLDMATGVAEGYTDGDKTPPGKRRPKQEKTLKSSQKLSGKTGAMETGIYSLKIEFPREGKKYIFKKLKSDAEIAVSFRDVKLGRKIALYIFLVSVMGLLVLFIYWKPLATIWKL